MSRDSGDRDRIKAVLVLLATVATIAYNGLAASGYIGGSSPQAISAKYPTIVTPAAYAFSIWSLIYVGLLAFSIYQLFPATAARFRDVRTIYILSCLLNCAWIYTFSLEQIGLCLAIIIGLAASLLLINIRLRGILSTRDTWLAQAPMGVYFGWVTAAALVNSMLYLKSADSPIAISPSAGAAILILAAACAVLVRITLQNFFYPLAVAWAATAIAIQQSGSMPSVVASAVAVIICLVTTGTFVTHLRDSSTT